MVLKIKQEAPHKELRFIHQTRERHFDKPSWTCKISIYRGVSPCFPHVFPHVLPLFPGVSWRPSTAAPTSAPPAPASPARRARPRRRWRRRSARRGAGRGAGWGDRPGKRWVTWRRCPIATWRNLEKLGKTGRNWEKKSTFGRKSKELKGTSKVSCIRIYLMGFTSQVGSGQ